MNQLRIIIPAVIVSAGLILTSTASFAKPEYTKKEKKGCAVCHVTASSKELNAVGKCYQEKKDIAACSTAK